MLDSVEQGAAGLVKVVVGVAKVRFFHILFFVVFHFRWFLVGKREGEEVV